MRKLLMLASFEAKTGELYFKEHRQLLIMERSGDDHFTLSKRAYSDIFWPWFQKKYPESECLSFMLYETIAADDDVAKTSTLSPIHWCEPNDNERAKHGYLVWVGPGGPLGQGYDGVVGEGPTKEAAALDFVEKFMIRTDYMVIRYDDIKDKE